MIPGLEAHLDDSAVPQAISCPAAGGCLVAGYYGTDMHNGFVMQEKGGKWARRSRSPPLPH